MQKLLEEEVTSVLGRVKGGCKASVDSAPAPNSGGRGPFGTTRNRSLVAAGMAVALMALVGWQGVRGGRPRPPDVFLVTVDTLRADSLGCYGRADAATPNFDRVAREGVLFENAVAPMPITRASHFSIMTSQFPRQHGVMNNSMALSEQALTLPEVFRAAGYHTVASVSVRILGADSGAAQGFDRFDAPSEVPTRSGSEALARLAALLRNRPEKQPVFVWLHVFEPHIPYISHGKSSAELPEVSWPLLLDIAARHQGAIPSAMFARTRQLYQEEVAEADRLLGGVLDILDRDDRPTLLAVAADHGECFEHGVFFEHADCLYEGAIRVPLLLRYPAGLEPRRRQDQVELRHLGSTLLSLAKLELPPSFEQASVRTDGESPAFFESPLYGQRMANALRSRTEQIRQVGGQAARLFEPATRQFGVRWRGWKYLMAGDREELYELGHDPHEQMNVVRTRRDMAEQLKRLVSEWALGHPLEPHDVTAVTPELRETLRSLGYLD